MLSNLILCVVKYYGGYFSCISTVVEANVLIVIAVVFMIITTVSL